MTEPAVSEPVERVSLREMALAFNHIALASFGGGLSAWTREVLVVRKRWMGESEFLSAMTMCRILPGSNQINMAVFAGTKLRGRQGAIAAVLGLCTVPVLLMLVMAFCYFHFKEVPAVKGVLHGASTAAVALTVTMAIQTGQKCLRGVVPIALCAATFLVHNVLHWHLAATVAVVAPLCLLWAWPQRRK